jgi:hypothetical protein
MILQDSKFTYPDHGAPVSQSMPIRITKGFMGKEDFMVSFTIPKSHYTAGEVLDFKVMCNNTIVPEAIEKIKITLTPVPNFRLKLPDFRSLRLAAWSKKDSSSFF